MNLAEQHGKEGLVVKAYEEAVKAMADDKVKLVVDWICETAPNQRIRYVGFDFHEECKGMRYENITKLTAQLETALRENE